MSHCALSVNVCLKSDRCWSITGGLFLRSSLRLSVCMILNIHHHHHCISDISFDPSGCWVNVFMWLHILSVAKHEYLLGGLGRRCFLRWHSAVATATMGWKIGSLSPYVTYGGLMSAFLLYYILLDNLLYLICNICMFLLIYKTNTNVKMYSIMYVQWKKCIYVE